MENSVNSLRFLTLTCFCVYVCACLFMHEKAFCTTCCRASCLFEKCSGNSRVRVSTYATTTGCVCVVFDCDRGHSCVTCQTQSGEGDGGGAVTHPTTQWVNLYCHPRRNLAVFNSVKARKAVLTSSQPRTGPVEMLCTD